MTTTRVCGGEFLVSEIDCQSIFTPEDFTDEHKQIALTTEQFVLNEVQPVNDRIEAKDFDLLLEKLRQCADLGLMMIDAPEKFGGLDLDKVTSMVVTEKLAWSLNFGLTYMCHTGIGMLPLTYYGTNDQKDRYFDGLISAEIIGAYCLTEPNSGSDALGARTTATLSGDGECYVLNGTKQFITNSGFADLFTVFAKVDKKLFTAFLVERSFPGLSFGPEERKMGMHGASTRQVIFDNVRVPKENVLGEVGKGHKIAFNVLNVGRFKLGALCVGQAKYALAEGARYANERKQFGVSIGSFGAIREKLADAVARIYASEAVVYRLAGMIDNRLSVLDKDADNYYVDYQKGIEEFAAECAIVKVFCTEAAAKQIDDMLQVHGGYGYIAEYPIEQMYRDERVQRIYEGTNEINRLLIPSIFMRRQAAEQPAGAETEISGFSSSFTEERRILRGMKRAYRLLSGHAMQRFGDNIGNEQEIMLALADLAIQIFALESVILRSEKALPKANSKRGGEYLAAAQVCTFSSRRDFVSAAEKCALYLGKTDIMKMLAAETALGPGDLLAAKRLLADAASQVERYIF